jgi:DNA-binding transcriptional MocR family regulator
MSVESASLLRLERTSLREQALTALRRAITTGELAAGTHLVETELSDALHISRGTLREAMRQLQQEGLISAGARGRLLCATSTRRKSRTSSMCRPGVTGRQDIGQPARPRRCGRSAAQGGDRDGATHGRSPGRPHRSRPEIPPHYVPTDRQRNPAALVVIAGGQHPDVDHVRRRGPGAEKHGHKTALSDRRRDRIR